MTTEQSTYTYKGHTDIVKSVAWSPDSKRIASASSEGTVHVWDAANGRLLYIYTEHGVEPVNTVAWHPKGTSIASGSNDTTVQVWQLP